MIRDRGVKKIKLFIDNVDISDSWYTIDIFESIDSPTWSCSIDILDGRNLLEEIPIIHCSEIKIQVETQDNCPTDEYVEFKFFIYKIGDKVAQNQNIETFNVKGVTKAFLVNNTRRLTKRFDEMKLTEILYSVAKNTFDDMITEVGTESDNTSSVLLNNWSPFISIGWLLKQTHKDNRADFMFYQNDVDTFMIDSIESMYTDSKNKINEIITYKVENTGRANHYNIIKHAWEHVDVQQNLQNGYYKSTVASYDFFNKSYGQTVYNHGDDKKEDLQIAPQWKDSLFDNSESSVISFIPKMPGVLSNETCYEDAEKWVPSRRAVLQRLDSEKFSAQLRGSIGMYKWIGKHIYIDMPSNNAGSGEFYSRFRKGNYLITAIAHHFTPSMYITNFEFVKLRVEE